MKVKGLCAFLLVGERYVQSIEHCCQYFVQLIVYKIIQIIELHFIVSKRKPA